MKRFKVIFILIFISAIYIFIFDHNEICSTKFVKGLSIDC